MLPFAIDPASFPDVPTRKAFIAIDLQNDFLAPDGALPVKQPGGMMQRIACLASAIRQSGHGDMIWVRSHFETNRTAGEQQIVAADTPQLPARLGSSASRGRHRPQPSVLESLDADPEAFLSVAGSGLSKPKPLSVRKGTYGAEFFPEIAAAKASSDYTVTKTFYSAFQSGQLLQLLRSRFATQLYICGALSNVSVYATALAASSYGFEITIVDDCCGYRSEVRHLNATRKLTELTGCEFSTAAEIIATLEPRSPKASKPGASTPPAIPAAVLAASEAKRGIKSVGSIRSIPVRLKTDSEAKLPTPPPSSSRMDDKAEATASLSEPRNSSSTPLSPREEASPREETPAASPSVTIEKDVVADKLAIASTGELEKPPKTSDALPESNPAVRTSADKDQAHDIKEQLKGADRKILTSAGESDIQDPTTASPPLEAETSSSKTLTQSVTASAVCQRPLTVDSSGSKPEDTPSAAKPDPVPPSSVGGRSLASGGAISTVKTSVQGDLEVGPIVEGPGRKGKGLAAENTPIISEPLCEGDTTVIQNVLPPELEAGIFEALSKEIHWLHMMHQGGEVPRLVAVQGSFDEDSSHPVYRHPSDEAPPMMKFTCTVSKIKVEIEKHLGHPVNHVLIQLYRGGTDYISEHSDKTLDIAKDSFIANLSLGAERTMVFRTKRTDKDPSLKDTSSYKQTPTPPATVTSSPQEGVTTATIPSPPYKETLPPQQELSKRKVQRVALPHNSLCRLGLKTNERWLHAIRQDKRLNRDKTASELAYGGARISLTFRRIGTFLDSKDAVIWGQGATSKTRESAKAVVNGQTPQAVAMLKAFGIENHSSDFDWDAHYGGGFDVLHMHAAPRYFGCGDPVVDARVKIMLAECGIKFARGSVGVNITSGLGAGEKTKLAMVKFVDSDAARTTVTGDVAILLYLDATYHQHVSNSHGKANTRLRLANVYSRFQAAIDLGDKWRTKWCTASADTRAVMLKLFRPDLAVFDAWAAREGVTTSSRDDRGGGSEATDMGIAGTGDVPSIADYALWPVLHNMVGAARADGFEFWADMGLRCLEAWYANFASRESVREVLGDVALVGPATSVPDSASKHTLIAAEVEEGPSQPLEGNVGSDESPLEKQKAAKKSSDELIKTPEEDTESQDTSLAKREGKLPGEQRT